MVGLTELWLVILLSAVIVFVASAVLHMALTYHRKDYDRMAGEADVMEAMGKARVVPGDYMFPWCSGMAELENDAVIEKFKKGPVGIMTVMPSGPPAMGKNLVMWFIYTLVVSWMVAYLTGRTVGAGAEYLQVFRVSGTAAFLAYALGEPIESVWKGRKWSTTIRNMFDGLVYALLTAGVFGWLYP